MKSSTRGFTFVEVLVVVAVIAIIAGAVWINFGAASAESRDAKRQADLRTLESAIELYRAKYGRYPAGCNSTGWSGQQGSSNECSDTSNSNGLNRGIYSGTNEFIIGHQDGIKFSPEFIRVIPSDPKPDPAYANAGYAYITNDDGTSYKLVTYRSVENELVTDYAHEFAFCDMSGSVDTAICLQQFTADLSSFTGSPNWCRNTDPQERFQRSYAVYGGFATPEYDPWDSRYEDSSEQQTELIFCDRP